MSESENISKDSPKPVDVARSTDIIQKAEPIPSKGDDEKAQKEETFLASDSLRQAQGFSQLDDVGQRHFYVHETINTLKKTLGDTEKRAEALEKENRFLRGVSLAKWFQLLGGVLSAIGALLCRSPEWELFGIGLFIAGIIVQFAALGVPEIQRWHAESKAK